jgi:hypothetical protein
VLEGEREEAAEHIDSPKPINFLSQLGKRCQVAVVQGLGNRKKEHILLLDDGVALPIRKNVEPVKHVVRLGNRWNQIDQALGTFSGFRARTILLMEPAKDETKRSSMRLGSRADCRTWKE